MYSSGWGTRTDGGQASSGRIIVCLGVVSSLGRPRRGILARRANAAVYNGRMDDASPGDWSPADHPYAIAVSEAQWWLFAVRLADARLRDRDDPRAAPVSSRQVDARNLVLALTQLLVAERLEQTALAELGVDTRVAQRLAEARSRFEAALPGLQSTRNALTHFDECARGSGHGPQRSDVSAGASRRQAARTYWGFGYDPSTRSVESSPTASESRQQSVPRTTLPTRSTTPLTRSIATARRRPVLRQQALRAPRRRHPTLNS